MLLDEPPLWTVTWFHGNCGSTHGKTKKKSSAQTPRKSSNEPSSLVNQLPGSVRQIQTYVAQLSNAGGMTPSALLSFCVRTAWMM